MASDWSEQDATRVAAGGPSGAKVFPKIHAPQVEPKGSQPSPNVRPGRGAYPMKKRKGK